MYQRWQSAIPGYVVEFSTCSVAIEGPDTSLICSTRLLRAATRRNEGGSFVHYAPHPPRLAARVLCDYHEAFACGGRTGYQAASIRLCLILCLYRQGGRDGVCEHPRCHCSSCPRAAATKLGTRRHQRVSDGLPDACSLQLPGANYWRIPEARAGDWLEARLSQT